MTSSSIDSDPGKAADAEFGCGSDTRSIPGPAGSLEVLMSCPTGERGDAIAVLCHPHPLHGGSMRNKVVHYLAKTFNELGLPALRFNFRGVGASDGSYDNAVGETEDLRAVLAWVRKHLPERRIWLAGFSFGAYVVLREGCSEQVERIITVAPPVNLFDFAALRLPSCPWLLVQGERDDVVPPDDVRRWAHSLPQPPQWAALPQADHFFHGQLNALHDALLQHLPGPNS